MEGASQVRARDRAHLVQHSALLVKALLQRFKCGLEMDLFHLQRTGVPVRRFTTMTFSTATEEQQSAWKMQKGAWVWFGLVWFGLVWFGLVWFGLVRASPPPPPPAVQRTLKSSKNTVRTGVFVGHAVRYSMNSVPKPGAYLFGSQKKYGPNGSVCWTGRWTRGGGGGGREGGRWPDLGGGGAPCLRNGGQRCAYPQGRGVIALPAKAPTRPNPKKLLLAGTTKF